MLSGASNPEPANLKSGFRRLDPSGVVQEKREMMTEEDWTQIVRRRRMVQWFIAPLTLIVIGLGWKYPALGFLVPAVMLMGISGGFFRGRYVCGNLCPRGAFFDRMIGPMSRNVSPPAFFSNTVFRWAVLAVLMGFMTYRILQNPGDWRHWGRVFWMMCVITTTLGVALGIMMRPRAWCRFCPVGTIQNAVGGGRHLLEYDGSGCRLCRICERKCPMDLPVVSWKDTGVVRERDCLKCSECAAACPARVLSWPQRNPVASGGKENPAGS